MLAFEGLIAKAGHDAGMKVPPDETLDEEGPHEGRAWDKDEFPHFHCFCALQLGRATSGPTEHWDNAKVIAKIPEEDLKTMTVEDFAARGVVMVIG